MKFICKIILWLNILAFLSCFKIQDNETLQILFLGGGSPEPYTNHNGFINYHKLKPNFKRNNMHITFSSNIDDLNKEVLFKYDAVIMYISASNDKPERVKCGE